MRCIPPNPRRVGYIVPIHGPLDGPLYMGSIYTNRLKILDGKHITREEIDLKFRNQHTVILLFIYFISCPSK